jgi:hypothetical protein
MQTVQLSKLQPDLTRLVKALQEDLRQRCDEVSEANAPLLAEVCPGPTGPAHPGYLWGLA